MSTARCGTIHTQQKETVLERTKKNGDVCAIEGSEEEPRDQREPVYPMSETIPVASVHKEVKVGSDAHDGVCGCGSRVIVPSNAVIVDSFRKAVSSENNPEKGTNSVPNGVNRPQCKPYPIKGKGLLSFHVQTC